MFVRRRGCGRCHRKRNAEKDCKGKRDLSHRERYLKSSTLTSTDQGGGKRQARMARRSWYYRVAVKLIFVIFGILGASAAQAQNAPWCLQTSSLGGYQSCTYATFEQCLVDRAAKNGFCTQNSTYQPGSPAIRRR